MPASLRCLTGVPPVNKRALCNDWTWPRCHWLHGHLKGAAAVFAVDSVNAPKTKPGVTTNMSTADNTAPESGSKATLQCQFCQSWNRVEASRAADRPKCGKCGNRYCWIGLDKVWTMRVSAGR